MLSAKDDANGRSILLQEANFLWAAATNIVQRALLQADNAALCIPWSAWQISDPGVVGMVRVDSDVHRALHLLVWPDVARGYARCKGLRGVTEGRGESCGMRPRLVTPR
jgi:hypothetical protein